MAAAKKKAAPKKAAKRAPAKPALEKRVEALEDQMAKIIALGPSVHKTDKYWKKNLG